MQSSISANGRFLDPANQATIDRGFTKSTSMKAITAIQDYFRGAIAEMKKVVWPTKKQTVQYSIIVIAISLGVAGFFSVLDYIFSYLLDQII